jgi:ribonuclease BN (tRNA processing enzyme)
LNVIAGSTFDGSEAAMSIDCCSRLAFINALAVSAYGASSAGQAIAAPAPSTTASARTRVVLLGTAGGPALRPGRSSPASAVVVDGVPYVVDCGYGMLRQLVNAGISPTAIRAVFVTHHHSDHNADLVNMVSLSWATGLKAPVDVYGPTETTPGPPPVTTSVKTILDDAFRYHGYDVAVRIPDEGRIDPRPLFIPHDVSRAGECYRDERISVEAAIVNHPPVQPALAYKFRTPDRVIVFSGDTTYSETLIAFARDADVLLHEVLLTSALDRLLKLVPNASHLREHIVAAHTDAEDVGRVAAAARVKRLVLTHIVPSYDPTLTDEDWAAPVRRHFSGDVVVGRDLLDV